MNLAFYNTNSKKTWRKNIKKLYYDNDKNTISIKMYSQDDKYIEIINYTSLSMMYNLLFLYIYHLANLTSQRDVLERLLYEII